MRAHEQSFRVCEEEVWRGMLYSVVSQNFSRHVSFRMSDNFAGLWVLLRGTLGLNVKTGEVYGQRCSIDFFRAKGI